MAIMSSSSSGMAIMSSSSSGMAIMSSSADGATSCAGAGSGAGAGAGAGAGTTAVGAGLLLCRLSPIAANPTPAATIAIVHATATLSILAIAGRAF